MPGASDPSPPRTRWSSWRFRRSVHPLLGPTACLVAFLLLRILQAACATETDAFDFEDGFAMAAAWEFVHGPSWPYAAYQYEDYEGGSRVMVLLAIPCMLWLGPSLLALKLPAIAISCATGVATYLVCRTAIGPRAAGVASVLYLLAPDPILGYGLVAKGSHVESTALQMAFLWGVLGQLRRPAGDRRGFALGLLAGLGVTFAYVSALMPAACALAWPWRTTMAFRPRAWIAFLAGLVAGVAPLVAYNALNNGLGMMIDGRAGFGFASTAGLDERFAAFVSDSLPAFLHFTGAGSALVRLYVPTFWLLSAIALAASATWTCGRPHRPGDREIAGAFLRRVVAAYTVAFVLAALLGGHAVWPYHLVPLLVLHLCGAAAQLAAWCAGPGRTPRLLAMATAAVLLAAGAVANARLLSADRLGIGMVVDARDYLQFYSRALIVERSRPGRTSAAAAAVLRQRLPVLDAQLPARLADPGLLRAHMLRSAPARLLRGQAPASLDFDTDFATGYRLAGWSSDQPSEPRIGKLLALLQDVPEEAREATAQGLGFALGGAPGCVGLGVLPMLPDDWIRPAAFGAGRGLRLSDFLDSAGTACTDEMPPVLREPLVRGVGYELGARSLSSVPDRIARGLPERLKLAFWSGVREGQRTGID